MIGPCAQSATWSMKSSSAVIGPVDVIQDQHQRVPGGQAFQEAAPGLEQVLAAHVARLARADERAELWGDAVVTE